jgi:DNA-binding MarR family transcriptional regulator
MNYDHLKLENQICFPVYAASRLITREYQPLLDELGITYPQYLVLLILWENEQQTVNEIAQKLILNTNTITPLLQRMENLALLQRSKSKTDERKTIISLTEKGSKLKEKAVYIPEKLASGFLNEEISLEQLVDLKNKLNQVIGILSEKKQ